MSSRKKQTGRTRAPQRPMAAPSAPSRRLSRPVVIFIAVILMIGLSGRVWQWHQNARPGAVALTQGQQDENLHLMALAQQTWLAGVQADPNYAPLRVALGDLDMQMGHYADAAAQYGAATKITPRDGTVFLALNRADLALQNVTGALAAARQATLLRPDDPDAQGLYGMLADKENDRATALAALTKAHQLRPDDRDYTMHLAMLQIRLSDQPAAEQVLAVWLKAHPTDPLACQFMAVIYEEKPRTPETLAEALRLAQIADAGLPGDMRVHITLGQLFLEANRPADALRIYQEGLTIDPNSAEMLHGVVNADLALGHAAQAQAAAKALLTETTRHQEITHLGDQISLNKNNEALVLARAHLEILDHSLPAALADYRALVQRNPNDKAARIGLMNLYQKMGRPDLAKRALDPHFIP
jgi:tetratricopeptide (TPR) repeat protein